MGVMCLLCSRIDLTPCLSVKAIDEQNCLDDVRWRNDASEAASQHDGIRRREEFATVDILLAGGYPSSNNGFNHISYIRYRYMSDVVNL